MSAPYRLHSWLTLQNQVNWTSEQLQNLVLRVGAAEQCLPFLPRAAAHASEDGRWTQRTSRCCRTKEKPDGLPEWRCRCYGFLRDGVVSVRWDSGALYRAFKTAQQQGSQLLQSSPSYTAPIRPWLERRCHTSTSKPTAGAAARLLVLDVLGSC